MIFSPMGLRDLGLHDLIRLLVILHDPVTDRAEPFPTSLIYHTTKTVKNWSR